MCAGRVATQHGTTAPQHHGRGMSIMEFQADPSVSPGNTEKRGSERSFRRLDNARPGAARPRCRSLPPRSRSRNRFSWSRGGSSCGRGSAKVSNAGQHEEVNRMRVGVRVRPVFHHEVILCSGRRSGYRPAVIVPRGRQRADAARRWAERGGRDQEPGNDNIEEEVHKHESEMLVPRQCCVELRMLNGRRRRFPFDHAFDEGCAQGEIYER